MTFENPCVYNHEQKDVEIKAIIYFFRTFCDRRRFTRGHLTARLALSARNGLRRGPKVRADPIERGLADERATVGPSCGALILLRRHLFRRVIVSPGRHGNGLTPLRPARLILLFGGAVLGVCIVLN